MMPYPAQYRYVRLLRSSGAGSGLRDACLKQTPLPNSQLTDAMAKEGFCDHHDHFENTTPNAEYKTCLEHAEKIGIGSSDYELITIS